MERQVSRLCQVCYFHLRRLRTVRRSLTKESLLTLVHAFVTSRIDHCNAVLWIECVPPRPSPVGPELGCAVDFERSQVQPNIFRHLWWTALVADREAYTLQDHSSCPALHRWDGTGVPGGAVLSGEPVYQPTIPAVHLSWWPCCSKIQTRNVGPQGLCSFWSSNLELTSGSKLDGHRRI